MCVTFFADPARYVIPKQKTVGNRMRTKALIWLLPRALFKGCVFTKSNIKDPLGHKHGFDRDRRTSEHSEIGLEVVRTKN
jgi:hypothetical protein